MLPAQFRKKKRGFTLIELMVVIAIIAILSVVGVVAYRGVTAAARDAKRKADLDAISKAYEVNVSNGNYVPLQDSFFASGVPKPPEGGDHYPCLIGPDSYCTVPSTTTYAYGVTLGSGNTSACPASSSSCYTVASSGSGSFPTLPGSSNPSCDPYGVLNYGLAGYWKMDNNANDATGINNGTWGGTESYASGVPYNTRFNNAGSFSGTGNYITVTDSGSLSLTNNITVSVWVKWNGRRPDEQQRPDGTWMSGQTILTHTGNGNNVCYSYVLYLDSVNQFSFLKECTFDGVSSYFTASANTWYHIVSTYNGSERKIYINNVLKGAPRGNAPTFVNGNILTIGAQKSGSSYFNFWNGLIDDVRIYNRALSPLEVSALYNSGQSCIP